MVKSQEQILPIHLAHRGFEIGLPTGYILKCIDKALKNGQLARPRFRMWPGDEPILVNIGSDTLERWKRHYEQRGGVAISEELRTDIDRILGMTELSV